jgi:hypothetical protein
MNNKLKPALLGGLIVGVLSAIPFINYCCCIWTIGGGALAAYLYVKSSPVPVRTGDGAIVGGLAGIIGGIIYLVIGLPLTLLFGAAAMQERLTRTGIEFPVSGMVLMIVAAIIGAVIVALLTTLGGVIGVAIFEKRKGNGPVPPLPPNPVATPGGYRSGM